MLIKRDNTVNSKWFLQGTLPNAKNWIIPIKKFPFHVGRNLDSDLALSSSNVSRNHAEIHCVNDELILRDLNSTNGTSVNYKKIKKDTKLKDSDVIHFGDVEFYFFFHTQENEDYYTKTNLLKDSASQNAFITQYRLTKKESEITQLLLEGKSTAKIAEVFNISKGTAKNHILNIYKKTGVHSKFELLALVNKSFTK